MSDKKPTCFIIMPITTPETCYEQYQGDKDHFEHVQNHLFKPAIEKAGFEPLLPKSTGSENIQAEIIEKLTTSDMVLCDMSILNANVFFELGVRTSLNKPVTLIVDDKTPKIPFDVGTINRETYKSALNGWEMDADIEMIANHIKESSLKAQGENALWKRFKIQETADFSTSDVTADDKLNLILNELRSSKETERTSPEIENIRPNLAAHFTPTDLGPLADPAIVSKLSREDLSRLVKVVNASTVGTTYPTCVTPPPTTTPAPNPPK